MTPFLADGVVGFSGGDARVTLCSILGAVMDTPGLPGDGDAFGSADGRGRGSTQQGR